MCVCVDEHLNVCGGEKERKKTLQNKNDQVSR